jgi:hypothetical protein
MTVCKAVSIFHTMFCWNGKSWRPMEFMHIVFLAQLVGLSVLYYVRPATPLRMITTNNL